MAAINRWNVAEGYIVFLNDSPCLVLHEPKPSGLLHVFDLATNKRRTTHADELSERRFTCWREFMCDLTGAEVA